MKHSHGPLKTPFCRQCRKARRLGFRYTGRIAKSPIIPERLHGQRVYAGPPQ